MPDHPAHLGGSAEAAVVQIGEAVGNSAGEAVTARKMFRSTFLVHEILIFRSATAKSIECPGLPPAPIRTCASHRNRLIALTFMIHHVVLYKLKPEVTPARVEAMMMNTRMQLLKIPEVLSIKCGKRVDPDVPWPFFIAIDFESMDKYDIFREDPVFVKFMEEIIKPNTEDSLTLDFEMDPGKDVRFS